MLLSSQLDNKWGSLNGVSIIYSYIQKKLLQNIFIKDCKVIFPSEIYRNKEIETTAPICFWRFMCFRIKQIHECLTHNRLLTSFMFFT